MIIGMIWYNPKVFGSTWMKLSGIDHKKIDKSKQKGMTSSYLLAFVGSLVLSYVLSFFIDALGYSTISSGAQFGFMVWLGFFATSMLSVVLWESKPWKLYFINVTYHLVSLVILSALLAAWK